MKKIRILSMLIFALFSMNLVSAVVLNSAESTDIFPGEVSRIIIEVENVFADDVTDLTISLNLVGLPFTPIGSSEDSIDELEEDEDEDFVFQIKAANDITPGDFQIPYTLKYDREGVERVRMGTIGVRVVSNTELSYSVDSENNIVGKQGKISLKIVNSGFGDVRFVSVKLIPESYTLLSDGVDYIGTIDSDDFETATFDVIFKGKNTRLIALVEYKDFDNRKIIDNVNLLVTVYTTEEAIELGIIKKSNAPLISGFVVTIILVWILWRVIKKRSRAKRRAEKGRK
jgi:hypothetical protein